jgi:HlyD family secretion protein
MKTHMRMGMWALVALLAAGCGGSKAGRRPSGSLEADELRLAPALAGRVLELRVAEGDSVAAGDTLLVLDASLLRLQREQSAAGLATLAARRQRVESQQAEARAAQALTAATRERVESLHVAGSATDQQRDEARAAQEQAKARVEGLGHERQALDAERAALESGLAVLDRQLRDAVLLAPSGGRILERYTLPGEWTVPGQPALLLADLSSLDLRVYLGETELGAVQLGRTLPVRVDAWPDTPFTGTVAWVSSEAEFTPKNALTRDARAQLVFAVRLTVANPDGRLLVGMPAEVELETKAK